MGAELEPPRRFLSWMGLTVLCAQPEGRRCRKRAGGVGFQGSHVPMSA